MAAVRGRLSSLPGSDMPGLAHLRTATTPFVCKRTVTAPLNSYRSYFMKKLVPDPPTSYRDPALKAANASLRVALAQ